MKHFIIVFWGIILVLPVLRAIPARAEDGYSYYVEIGRDTTREEATNEWNELVAEHKSLLGKLQFYPKAVYQGGVAVSTRIQAGPISDKTQAHKICKKLFSNDVPCFVIESLDDAPPTAVANLTEQAGERANSPVTLPWLHSSEVGGPPPVRETSALPWLKPQASRAAQVQVAEAIRVPLSDAGTIPKDAKVTVKSLPEPRPTFRSPFAEGRSESPVDNMAGWLSVDTFPNADIATAYWDEVRSSMPRKKTSALRVRITRPLMAQNHQGRASLNIGPFASSNEAYAFCDTMQARERGLNCSYLGGEPGQATARTIRHSDGYNSRRTQLARRRPAENPPSNLMPAAGPTKQYWVQVVQAPTQMEALNQWNAMRAGNGDLLNGMRSSVSASATDRNTFVVRVGPITDNDQAVQFCTKLQERSINCRVLLYSVGM